MSKLIKVINQLKNDRGSALVGAVVFSLVIALTSAGYFAMLGTTVSHEVTSLDNDRAFYAAESGLLLGIRWMMDTANFNNLNPNPIETDIIAQGQLSINNMNVRVTYINNGVNNVDVISMAQGGRLPYTKQIRLSMGNSNMNHGTFINDATPPPGGVGGGGFNNVWFDGPYHSNTPIYLSSVSNPGAAGAGVYFLNGNASVHNDLEERNFRQNGEWGNYNFGQTSTDNPNNDYTYGIYKHGLSENTYQADRLDNHFDPRYKFRHSQPELGILPLNIEDVNLPPNPSTAPDKTALLYFYKENDVGKAKYYTFSDNGDTVEHTYNVIDEKIFRGHNNVKVLGEVEGKTTVVTNADCDIIPIGDLTYTDFNFTNPSDDYLNYNNERNYGIDLQSDNALALIAGGNIEFQPKKYSFNRNNRQLTEHTNSDERLFVTAALYAFEDGHSIIWETRNRNIIPLNYHLRVIGTRTIDKWVNYDAGGVQNNDQVRFYYDSRLSSLHGPGIPQMVFIINGTPLLSLSGGWTETNTMNNP